MRTRLAPPALWLMLALAVLALTLPAPRAQAADPAAIPFVSRTVTTGAGTFGYQVFVPAHWNGRRPVATILFLHGSGEARGRQPGADQERHPPPDRPGPGRLPRRRRLPAVPRRRALDGPGHGGDGAGGAGPVGQRISWRPRPGVPDRPVPGRVRDVGSGAEISPTVGRHRAVLRRRHLPPPARHRPRAWLAPRRPRPDVARKVVSLPAWVFHGGADPTVPVSESRQMVALLFALKPDVKPSELRYTEYPGVGHNSWDYAYKEAGLLPWFLSHRRPQ